MLLFLVGASIALGFGALGALLALRAGSGEAIQGLFPVLFVFLFISSMNMPANLIEIDWFRDRRDREPGLVHARGRPEPDHQRWDAETILLGSGSPRARSSAALGDGVARARFRLTG